MEMDIHVPANSMGIRGYDYVEFYVGSAKLISYWYVKALGFDITAYCGPETGVRDRTSFYLENNNVRRVRRRRRPVVRRPFSS